MDHTQDGIRIRDPRPSDEGAPAGGWVIADAASDALLGGITLIPARHQAEITFWVAPHARRRGVATTALRAVTGHAFGAGHQDRLELLIPWDNPVAQRVALAAGYGREGVRRGAVPNPSGGRDDVLVHARLRTDPDEPVTRLLPDLPGGELSDGVVTLRPLGPQDIDFYRELQNLPEVISTSVPPIRKSDAEMRRRCARAQAQWLAGTSADLVVVDAATGADAGEISLYYQEPPTGQAMIGYAMLPAFRGRGMATRAAQLLSLWAFAETGIVRLIAGALPTNLGSQRVLEKAGFQREAYLRSRLPGADGARNDDVQFVLLAGDLLRQASGQG